MTGEVARTPTGPLDHGRHELVRVDSHPRSPAADQLRPVERTRTVQRGNPHVPDRIGVRPQDDFVDEAVDRADQEAAHRHLKWAEPVFVAPLLLVLAVVPQRLQFTAEHVNRA